jgi:predicted lipoprotein
MLDPLFSKFILLAFFALIACSKDTNPLLSANTQEKRERWEIHYRENLQIRLTDFNLQTKILENSHFCDSSIGFNNLDSLQSQWKKTVLSWSLLEGLLPSSTQYTQRQVHSWPSRENLISSAIVSLKDNSLNTQTSAPLSKGLSALEFLLFGPEFDAFELEETKCQYSLAISSELNNQAQILNSHIKKPELNWLNEAIQNLGNALARIQKIKLFKPIEGNGKVAWPQNLELHLSLYSKESIIATLTSTQTVLDRHRGILQLAEPDLRAEIDSLASKIIFDWESLEPSLSHFIQKNREVAFTLQKEIKQLQNLVEWQLGPQLNVDLGFSDVDGD